MTCWIHVPGIVFEFFMCNGCSLRRNCIVRVLLEVWRHWGSHRFTLSSIVVADCPAAQNCANNPHYTQAPFFIEVTDYIRGQSKRSVRYFLPHTVLNTTALLCCKKTLIQTRVQRTPETCVVIRIVIRNLNARSTFCSLWSFLTRCSGRREWWFW